MVERQVRMLTAMAGAAFSYLPGEVVSVHKDVAKSWIKARIAEEPPGALQAEKVAKDATARVAELEQLLAEANADREALKTQAEQLGGQVAELGVKLAASTPPLA